MLSCNILDCKGQSINPRHIKRSSLIHQYRLIFPMFPVSLTPPPEKLRPQTPNHTQSSTIYPQLLGRIGRSAGHGQVHETQPKQTECENFAHMTEQLGWVLGGWGPGNGEIVGGWLCLGGKGKSPSQTTKRHVVNKFSIKFKVTQNKQKRGKIKKKEKENLRRKVSEGTWRRTLHNFSLSGV